MMSLLEFAIGACAISISFLWFACMRLFRLHTELRCILVLHRREMDYLKQEIDHVRASLLNVPSCECSEETQRRDPDYKYDVGD